MKRQVSRAASIALTGLEGTAVVAEAAVTNQLPGMAIIGLPDTAIAEAKQRVRLATQHIGFSLSNRFLTVNLSPAAIPKHGSGFDLAIALAAIAASGHLAAPNMHQTAHLGELGLDGDLRRPHGLLTAVIAAQQLGFAYAMVPAHAAHEASLVPGITVIAVHNLRDAVQWYLDPAARDLRLTAQTVTRQHEPSDALFEESKRETVEVSARATPDGVATTNPDISEIVGQPEAVEMLTIAAAGRHHISLVGPPGAGKTLLASQLPSILPDLDAEESLVASSIASLGGTALTELVRRPPFVSPHHTASKTAVIGGGEGGTVRPGAVTRATHGVLFLDEAAEFARDVLESLRQPLESGTVEIQRARVTATLPARVQLVLASNPCPCGYAGVVDIAEPCTCPPSRRISYLKRISGPLSDRIDLRMNVRRVLSVVQSQNEEPRLTSAEIRSRVLAARERAAERWRDTPWRVNGDVPGTWLRRPELRLPRADTIVLDQALRRGSLTVRGYDRTLRLGWTIADLTGKERPGRAELARALTLRGGAGV